MFYNKILYQPFKSSIVIIFLCGLSGAGKTTLSDYVKEKLANENIAVEVIDADKYRLNLYPDLGFSKQDRIENIRRLGFLADQFSAYHIIPIVCSITPYEEMRTEMIKKYKDVKVIHIDCPLNCLIKRDTKGLYKRAFLPEENPLKISNLSGVNDPFEVPSKPDLYINTYQHTIKQSANSLYSFIKKHNIKN